MARGFAHERHLGMRPVGRCGGSTARRNSRQGSLKLITRKPFNTSPDKQAKAVDACTGEVMAKMTYHIPTILHASWAAMFVPAVGGRGGGGGGRTGRLLPGWVWQRALNGRRP